jgi:hypothetical protein
MDSEFELLIEALQIMEGRIKATEVSQQLMAAHLADAHPDIAENIASTMNNVSQSEHVDAAPEVRDFLVLMAKHLNGDHDAGIRGLLNSAPEKEPIPWLKGVIDGGKKS